jgi:hypothetical protein
MRRRLLVCVFALLSLAGERARAQEELSLEEPTAAVQQPRAAMPVLVMLIGGGAKARDIRLDVGDGAGGIERRELETSVYFDFGWHLFVRPMGQRSIRPAIQAIVIQIDGGAAIGLDVQPAGVGGELEPNAWRLLGQLGYLYPRNRLQFGGLVGVGGDVFTIDANPTIPSSSIVYVRLGPAVSYDIVRGFLRIRADVGVRIPFLLGQLEDAFGSESRSVGADATITFDGRLKAGFGYAFRAIWEYYHYRFLGPTMMIPAQGGNGDGNDYALTLQFLIGWSL